MCIIKEKHGVIVIIAQALFGQKSSYSFKSSYSVLFSFDQHNFGFLSSCFSEGLAEVFAFRIFKNKDLSGHLRCANNSQWHQTKKHIWNKI